MSTVTMYAGDEFYDDDVTSGAFDDFDDEEVFFDGYDEDPGDMPSAFGGR